MADKCTCCSKSTAGAYAVGCGNCGKWFHITCVGVTRAEHKNYAEEFKKEDGKKWYCKTCRDEVQNSNKKSKANPAVTIEPTEGSLTLQDVMNKLNKMEQKYDKVYNLYEKQIKINEELQNEVGEMRKQLEQLQEEQKKQQQHWIKKNVIITGIPIINEKEDTKQLVAKIENILEVENAPITAYRIGRKIKGSVVPIKIEFEMEKHKNKFMEASKTKKLSTKDIGYEENKPVRIRHEMTKENRELFKEALNFKIQNEYKFLWFKNSTLLIRKDEVAKPFIIKNKHDLNKLPKNF